VNTTAFQPRLFCFVFALSLSLSLFGQEYEPTDYLPKSFHEGRREALRSMMPANSVFVVFAAPTRRFSNDVEYLYHPNPDLYYFSGYKEPNSLLLIFKEPQHDSAGKTYTALMFVQKRNPAQESWTGRRLGVEGVQGKLGIRMAFNGEKFRSFPLDLSGFDRIIYDLPEELETSKFEDAELAGLLKTFKRLAGIDATVDAQKQSMLAIALQWDLRRQRSIKAAIESGRIRDSLMLTDPDLRSIIDAKDSSELVITQQAIKSKMNNKLDNRSYFEYTAALRERKTPEEKVLLRKAVEISCAGQKEVMRAAKPEMSELEIQGLHEYVHKKYGAEEVGYGSIIGAGENGCILHYETNTKTRIGTDLVLMDVGAEYHGYTADVTRTIPAKGKFSTEQKAIYQIVYDAQEAAFKKLKDSASWRDVNSAADSVLSEGLLKLGIISKKGDFRKYYTHGLGHHIGMDVHDRGTYGQLREDMVITIEPGIYIPEGSDCDKKWWGIGIRIEDDALITKKGYELLSAFAPRSIADIEKLMAEKSPFDNFQPEALPSDKGKKAF